VRDWSWIYEGLRFAVADGDPVDLVSGVGGVEHVAGSPPGYAPSAAWQCGTLKCDNKAAKTGYRWDGLQDLLFAGTSTSTWTVAFTMCTWTVTTPWKVMAEVSTATGNYLRFGVHANLFAWPGFYVGCQVNDSAGLYAVLSNHAQGNPDWYGLHGNVADGCEFPVVVTMNANWGASNTAKIYAHGKLFNANPWAKAAWSGTTRLVLGCNDSGLASDCNDGNYAAFLVSENEWSAEQVAEWSNDPLGWYFEPRPNLADAYGEHFNVSLGTRARMAADLGARARAGVAAGARARMGVDAGARARMGVALGARGRMGVDLGVRPEGS